MGQTYLLFESRQCSSSARSTSANIGAEMDAVDVRLPFEEEAFLYGVKSMGKVKVWAAQRDPMLLSQRDSHREKV